MTGIVDGALLNWTIWRSLATLVVEVEPNLHLELHVSRTGCFVLLCCLFLHCHQVIIFTAALQHSTIRSGLCATEHLCGNNAEPVQVTVLCTDVVSLDIAASPAELTHVKLHHSSCLSSRASTCSCKLMQLPHRTRHNNVSTSSRYCLSLFLLGGPRAGDPSCSLAGPSLP